MLLEGKVALVTGGARGIGAAYCTVLAKNGVSVAICDILDDEGKKLESSIKEEGGKAIFLHCDVTNKTEFENCFKAAIKEFGQLDIVVNNAGIINDTESGWRKEIDINLCGVIEGSLLALKYLKRGGVIAATSSIAALYNSPWYPIYAATKAGINYFVRSLGCPQCYSATGIKLYAIAPGSTETPIFEQIYESKSLLPGFNLPLIEQLKNEYIQKPESVANCLLHILKEDAPSGSVWFVEKDTWRLIDLDKIME